jgi:hypothetical protein
MKKAIMVLFLLTLAGSAQADTIWDIQHGAFPDTTWVTVEDVVVTADAYYGICVAESPYDAWRGIWVYLGSGHGHVAGEVVDIHGVYYEYYGLSEIDVKNYELDGAYCTTVGSMVVPDPNYITAADIMADPEPLASCLVTITDALIVTELLAYNEWMCTSYEDGVTEIQFGDEYFFGGHPWQLNDCFNNATGFWTYSYGAYKLEAFADGLPSCEPVDAEQTSFGHVKALYR